MAISRQHYLVGLVVVLTTGCSGNDTQGPSHRCDGPVMATFSGTVAGAQLQRLQAKFGEFVGGDSTTCDVCAELVDERCGWTWIAMVCRTDCNRCSSCDPLEQVISSDHMYFAAQCAQSRCG